MASPQNSWNFAYILGLRPSFFCDLHLRIRENSHVFWEENQDLWKCAHFLKGRPFFWSSPQNSRWTHFSFSSHSRIQINKVFVPPQNLFMSPPPVTRSWRRACRASFNSCWCPLIRFTYTTTRQQAMMEKEMITFKHNFRLTFSGFFAELMATSCNINVTL